MCLFKFMGLLSIIPATIFLTISFFVLFTAKKSEAASLKSFGWVIAILLWISAALVFSGGIYSVASGGPMGMMKHHTMMKCGMMKEMPCPMMNEGQKEHRKEMMMK